MSDLHEIRLTEINKRNQNKAELFTRTFYMLLALLGRFFLIFFRLVFVWVGGLSIADLPPPPTHFVTFSVLHTTGAHSTCRLC